MRIKKLSDYKKDKEFKDKLEKDGTAGDSGDPEE